MIARLIAWCAHNRGMVLLLTACLVAVGVWSAYRITVDAIPDLSDVQVVIRTDYPGRAPQIVQDQVTNPLTTAMLAVPGADVVRGQSMFGTSFIYIIFEDGTDLYWARSRVLEQISAIGGQLPEGVEPEIGPDATGVGWVYQYALITGKYCADPDHARRGLWRDPETDRWYEHPAEAPQRDRLAHHRVFDEGRETCPIDGEPLQASAQDLSDLRGLQDWLLRYELTPVQGVSEVVPVGGFVKQYQVVVDPVKLLAYDMPLGRVKRAIQRSNRDAGGRVIERGETEYMVRSLGYLGQLSRGEAERIRDEGGSLDRARTKRALAQLRQVSLGADENGSPIYLDDVAEVQVGPEIRRGIAELDGQGEVVGGIVVMRHGENARDTIEAVRAKLTDVERSLPPGVAVKTVYDRSDLIDRSIGTLRHTLIEEILVVSVVIVLFLLHARSALVAAFVLPTGVLATLAVMHGLDINANIMSLGGIAISIGVMVDSAIVMVENAHKHLERERERVEAGASPRDRATVIAEAAAEVGPTLFFSLLIITISFLPIFVLTGQSGRLFQPLAYTKTFAMAAAALLAVTIIPVLMVYFIRERMVPRAWPVAARLAMYALLIVVPAAALALVPLPTLAAYRWWLVGGWVVLSALLTLPQGFVS
ncbi:MAG: efflux RND transporter permease subunit, partial [Phycisphaeraceae bacterium]